MKCLLAHHVLSSPLPAKNALPKGVTVSAQINAGFAMIPAQATDSATILFAVNPTAATKAMARLIVADNTLYSGSVVDTEGPITRFNEHVAADPRSVQVLLTVRDGITLIRLAD